MSATFSGLIGQARTVAVIGGGGKTGLIGAWEAEFNQAGQAALVTLTTHIGRGQLPELERVEARDPQEALEAARASEAGRRLLLAGPRTADSKARDKFEALPAAWFPPLRAAFKGRLLIEADGSRGLPLKAHRPDEPVLPPVDFFLTAVLGLSALTEPVARAVHRLEIVGAVLGRALTPETILSPEAAAYFILAGWRRLPIDLLFINQADSPERLAAGRRLSELLTAQGAPFRVIMGSLHERRLYPVRDANNE